MARELSDQPRQRRMVERRIKAAKFPTVKGLDSFDFAAIPKELFGEMGDGI